MILRLLFVLLLTICAPSILHGTDLRTLEIQLSFDSSAVPGKTVGGYTLYQDSVAVCVTYDASATSIICDVPANSGSHIYELAVHYTDNTESPKSPPFAFLIGEEETLKAIANSSITKGIAPVSVTFDASGSIGDLVKYKWDFGDGSTEEGITVTHKYNTPGSYEARLYVTNSQGSINSATVSLTIADGTSNAPLPVAKISSSPSNGHAPLAVQVDGSDSYSENGSIVSYEWNFGDGIHSTGKTSNHTFTAEGIYTISLKITDDIGKSSSITTPVIVSSSGAINQKPTASLAVIQHTAPPLSVTFYGSGSLDLDGSVTNYFWNFGDGTSSTGKTVTHTYTSPATYNVSLYVTDDQGIPSDTAFHKVTVNEEPYLSLNYEVGELELTSEWSRVSFFANFFDPVVFIGPPTRNGYHPTVTRIRNLNNLGFDINLQEWDYLDGFHVKEKISYFVIEKSATALTKDSTIEVGTFTGTTSLQEISFDKEFVSPPVVLTTIVTMNDPNAVAGRISEVSRYGFKYVMQEHELTQTQHLNESVAYLAIPQGNYPLDNHTISANILSQHISSNQSNILFDINVMSQPFFFAEQQTMIGYNPATIRIKQLNQQGATIFLQEEQSKDKETWHVPEQVGYLLITE